MKDQDAPHDPVTARVNAIGHVNDQQGTTRAGTVEDAPPTPVEVTAAGLLPCPFCGGEATRSRYSDYEYGCAKYGWQMTSISCASCDISLDYGDDDAAAVAWNTRATTPSAASDVRAALEWQPIETAPLHVEIDLWCHALEGEGWRKTGELVAREPHHLIDENGDSYWPHENGGWFTHWMPLPAPPLALIPKETL